MSDSISEYALSLTNLSKRVLIDISILELFEAHFLKETLLTAGLTFIHFSLFLLSKQDLQF